MTDGQLNLPLVRVCCVQVEVSHIGYNDKGELLLTHSHLCVVVHLHGLFQGRPMECFKFPFVFQQLLTALLCSTVLSFEVSSVASQPADIYKFQGNTPICIPTLLQPLLYL